MARSRMVKDTRLLTNMGCVHVGIAQDVLATQNGVKRGLHNWRFQDQR